MELLPSLAAQQTPSVAKMNRGSLVERNMAMCFPCTRRFKCLLVCLLCGVSLAAWTTIQLIQSDRSSRKGVEVVLVDHQQIVKQYLESVPANIIEETPTGLKRGEHKHPGDRYLIYTCRHNQYCGGLSDRFRGISHAFILAAATKRRFGIHMEFPGCEFSSMLGVGKVDWRVSMTSLEASNLTWQEYNRVNNNSFITGDLETKNLESYFNKDILYYTSNQILLHALLANKHHVSDFDWLRGIPHPALFAELFNTLFRLAPSLQQQVDDVVAQVRRRGSGKGLLVATQIRYGRNPTMPKDTWRRLSPAHLQLVWAFLKSYSSNSETMFFVSSDSEAVLEEARVMLGDRLLRVGGPVVHVAYPTKNADVCAGMQRVLVDLHVLAASDVLLLTRSGIGDMATDIRGVAKGELYCLRTKEMAIMESKPYSRCH